MMGTPMNPASGRDALLTPEESWDLDMRFRAAMDLRCGHWVERELPRFRHWAREAADQGFLPAQLFLAQSGLAGTWDGAAREASQWLGLTAAQNHPGALARLGHAYRNGSGLPEDPARAFECFAKAAELSPRIGAFDLAACYAAGTGVAPDGLQAAQWFEAAAQAHHPVAALAKGICAWRGQPSPGDLTSTVAWYLERSSKEVTCLQDFLALADPFPDRFQLAFPTAVAWFKASGDQGNPTAQTILGLLLGLGLGGSPNPAGSLSWLARASACGNPLARLLLAAHPDGIMDVSWGERVDVPWFGMA